MKRSEVLEELNVLFIAREFETDKKLKDKIEDEITRVGNHLNIDRRETRIQNILERGSKMSIDDFLYLKASGYKKIFIKEQLGMSDKEYNEFQHKLKQAGINIKGDIYAD